MPTQFVSEALEVIAGTQDMPALARGEPGLPERFRWRSEEYTVEKVLETWRETSPCRHSGKEQYVRKHWFRFRTARGIEMKVYFERQAKSARQRTQRWWLQSLITEAEE